MTVLNLTQHPATPDQVEAGVVEPPDKALVQRLLTFDEIPDPVEIATRAFALADIAAEYADYHHVDAVMIGGAPYLMSALEAALKAVDIQPVYAFTRRDVVERVQPDGSVAKIAVFRFAGWVRPWPYGEGEEE
jgi:hypothetical protein